jgi:hypothetical protein
MKIKQKKMVFHNVISLKGTAKQNEWFKIAIELRNFIIQNGLYVNAPIFYQCVEGDNEAAKESGLNEYTIYMPLNRKIEISGDVPVSFHEEITIEEALVFRQADINTSVKKAYLLLEACASDQGYSLKQPFYHVYLDVFGEGMLDIIAPIERKQ